MNNEEKKQYIIDAHRLYMKYRPYDGVTSINDAKKQENEFWNKYYYRFYESMPKSLFKYRKPTKKAIENFEKNTTWFSHPVDFDDTC